MARVTRRARERHDRRHARRERDVAAFAQGGEIAAERGEAPHALERREIPRRPIPGHGAAVVGILAAFVADLVAGVDERDAGEGEGEEERQECGLARAEDGAQASGVVRADDVPGAQERLARVRGRDRGEVAGAELARDLAFERGDHALAEVVVHDAVDGAGLEVGRGPAHELARHSERGSLLGRRLAQLAADFEAEIVGAVDPPAARAAPQPASHHSGGRLEQLAAQLRVLEPQLGQVRVSAPADRPARGVEAEPGTARARGRLARLDKPGVLVAHMVQDDVEDEADTLLAARGDEALPRGVAAEARVDLRKITGVVPVTGRRVEDRRQVERVGAEAGDVVEPLGDPVEVAAEQLAPRRPRARVPRGRVLEARVVGARELGGERVRAADREPIGEDLIDEHRRRRSHARLARLSRDRRRGGLAGDPWPRRDPRRGRRGRSRA